jgi:hypothetical protein
MTKRKYQPGALVHVRKRDWVVLPSPDSNLLILKPLGGSEDDTIGIYLPLGFKEVKHLLAVSILPGFYIMRCVFHSAAVQGLSVPWAVFPYGQGHTRLCL